MKSFDALWSELEDRALTRPDGSASVAALENGTAMIAKKVLEEAGEVFAAANHESDDALATEISQLIYWTQLLAISRGLSRRDIEGKL